MVDFWRDGIVFTHLLLGIQQDSCRAQFFIFFIFRDMWCCGLIIIMLVWLVARLHMHFVLYSYSAGLEEAKKLCKGQILAYRAMHMCPNSYSHSVLPHQSAKKFTALAKTPLYCLFLVFLEMKSYRSGGCMVTTRSY